MDRGKPPVGDNVRAGSGAVTMPSFLDLVPQWHTATVTIDAKSGPAEFEVSGIKLAQLAEICKRFPAFARVIEGGAGLLSAIDALPSLVAGGLGHCGDAKYEAQAASLPIGTLTAIAGEVMRLSFPAAAVPLSNGADVTAPEAAAAPPDQTSPRLLSN